MSMDLDGIVEEILDDIEKFWEKTDPLSDAISECSNEDAVTTAVNETSFSDLVPAPCKEHDSKRDAKAMELSDKKSKVPDMAHLIFPSKKMKPSVDVDRRTGLTKVTVTKRDKKLKKKMRLLYQKIDECKDVGDKKCEKVREAELHKNGSHLSNKVPVVSACSNMPLSSSMFEVMKSTQAAINGTDKKNVQDQVKQTPLSHEKNNNTDGTNDLRMWEGKNPIQFLNEISQKKGWAPPQYMLLKSSGSGHLCKFLFKVEVNGRQFRGKHSATTKKRAKHDAADVCIRKMQLG